MSNAAVLHTLYLRGAEHTVAVDPAVILAPMAGVTNAAFRTLCRRYGGGLFVSEMVGARSLVEATRQNLLNSEGPVIGGRRRTLLRAVFDREEDTRSVQLYAIDPTDMANGVSILVNEDLADHIDINVGCPARKVTRAGGGAALPWKTDLFASIVSAAVDAAEGRPVTVKMRKGIDAEHLTYLEAGRIARDSGAAAVTLHGRTAEDAYGGHADWDAIGRLVETIGGDIPVLGNGDIWSGQDAVAMVRHTGCAGVVVGRGCLGRPWLFRDLEAALAGQPIPTPPTLGESVTMLIEHAELLIGHLGEPSAMRDIRKHTGWYTQGFVVGKPARIAMRRVETLAELVAAFETCDLNQPMPASAVGMKRGHTHGPKPVRLPEGWLDSPCLAEPLPDEAAIAVSGG